MRSDQNSAFFDSGRNFFPSISSICLNVNVISFSIETEKNLFNKKYYDYESKSLDSYAPANERNFYAEFKFDF